MDIDFYDEFPDEKKRKNGSCEYHKWTEEEIIQLLKSIALMIKEQNEEFERPTARQFYEKLKHAYFPEMDLTYNVIKNKIRHLKGSYYKAVEWKDQVGMELYTSDQKHINARVKSICPYYNLLDDIFGTSPNSDPIGFRLPDEQNGDETVFYDNPSKKAKADNGQPLIVPKIETFHDEQVCYGEETHDNSNVDDFEESFNTYARAHRSRCKVFDRETNTKATKRQHVPTANNISLEGKQFQLEKQRFQVYYAFESRRISLEEKKFKFEVDKFQKMQKMKKYEIDKQFAIKKQEIESNERLRLLELGHSDERATVTLHSAKEVDEIDFEQHSTEAKDEDEEE